LSKATSLTDKYYKKDSSSDGSRTPEGYGISNTKDFRQFPTLNQNYIQNPASKHGRPSHPSKTVSKSDSNSDLQFQSKPRTSLKDKYFKNERIDSDSHPEDTKETAIVTYNQKYIQKLQNFTKTNQNQPKPIYENEILMTTDRSNKNLILDSIPSDRDTTRKTHTEKSELDRTTHSDKFLERRSDNQISKPSYEADAGNLSVPKKSQAGILERMDLKDQRRAAREEEMIAEMSRGQKGPKNKGQPQGQGLDDINAMDGNQKCVLF
jgi:hypothetical protein